MNATLEDLLDVLTPDAMIGDVERRSQQARGEVSWPDELFSGPDGFLDEIREQLGDGPLERPPQGEFEQREDW